MKCLLPAFASMLLLCANTAGAQQCLHGPDETPEQNARRKQALTLARVINTVQAKQKADTGRFAELGHVLRLPEVTKFGGGQTGEIAPGWQLRLAVDGDGYVFAIKDTTDPCRFALFSDQEGMIYIAKPIR
jgi:hypothetical protein